MQPNFFFTVAKQNVTVLSRWGVRPMLRNQSDQSSLDIMVKDGQIGKSNPPKGFVVDAGPRWEIILRKLLFSGASSRPENSQFTLIQFKTN